MNASLKETTGVRLLNEKIVPGNKCTACTCKPAIVDESLCCLEVEELKGYWKTSPQKISKYLESIEIVEDEESNDCMPVSCRVLVAWQARLASPNEHVVEHVGPKLWVRVLHHAFIGVRQVCLVSVTCWELR